MASLIYQSYKPIFHLTRDEIPRLGKEIMIPSFSQKTITKLCQESKTVLKKQEAILTLDGEFIVVGDLHGNLFDLLRILICFGVPSDTQKCKHRYLFLGDYVDRGQFSMEVITLLLALLNIFPDHFFLLKGNHEMPFINQNYGFLQEITKVYGNATVWQQINDVFSFLPICAIINHSIFCVHGGISSSIQSYEQLLTLRKSNLSPDDAIMDFLWSDPTCKTKLYQNSGRGKGHEYGIDVTKEFLSRIKCQRIIRAHQTVAKGVVSCFDGMVITVFSSSQFSTPPLIYTNDYLNPKITDYNPMLPLVEDNENNSLVYCGALIIDYFSKFKKVIFPPIAPLLRDFTVFQQVTDENVASITSITVNRNVVCRDSDGNLKLKNGASNSYCALLTSYFNTQVNSSVESRTTNSSASQNPALTMKSTTPLPFKRKINTNATFILSKIVKPAGSKTDSEQSIEENKMNTALPKLMTES